MTNGFKQSKTFQDIFIGMAIAFTLSVSVQQVFHRPEEPIVIEKQVIVKVPVYLNKQDKKQIKCLAENAYFEAGNQTTKGKIAVTNVVMNRVNDPKERYGKTPCAVVSQKKRGTCQFSWKCAPAKIQSNQQFAEAKNVAEQVYLGNYGDVTGGATFYHANYVSPNWNLHKVKKIGAHIFYKEENKL